MDPVRVGIRALLAYAFLLVLLRLAGKRTVYQGAPFDFVLALVLGDIVDDMLWSEVPVAQTVVAAATLVITKLTIAPNRGRMFWRARSGPGGGPQRRTA
jgi:uncharacterized membrane protein YcaP (DUF421 family)